MRSRFDFAHQPNGSESVTREIAHAIAVLARLLEHMNDIADMPVASAGALDPSDCAAIDHVSNLLARAADVLRDVISHAPGRELAPPDDERLSDLADARAELRRAPA